MSPLRQAGLIGLLAVGLSAWLPFVYPPVLPWTPLGITTPSVAFELAESSDEVRRLFGTGLEQVELVAQMDRGTLVDLARLTLTAIFVMLLGRRVAKLSGDPAMQSVVVLALVAFASGATASAETFAITSKLDTTLRLERQLEMVNRLTWIEWGAFAVALPLMAPFAWSAGGFGRVAAVASIVPLPSGAFAYLDRGFACEVFTASLTAAMFTWAVFAVVDREDGVRSRSSR